jgi:hypothetical protein
MGKAKSQEEGMEGLLSFYMYCGTHRNNEGFWEQVYRLTESVPESRINCGSCPEGFEDDFPDKYVSFCEKKRITVKEKIMPERKVLPGCFFIVNNKGYLFGEYDKKQRC